LDSIIGGLSMTASTASPQDTVLKYLDRQISLDAAVAALVTAMAAQRAAGGNPDTLALRKPDGRTLSGEDYTRVDALMAELDRRLSEA